MSADGPSGASWTSHPGLQDRVAWSTGRRVVSWVWALAPIWTIGIANPAVFIYAAVRRRTPVWWVVAVAYSAALVVIFSLSTDDKDSPRYDLYGGLLVANIAIGAGHALATRRRVFEPGTVLDLSNEPVIARALHAQERRRLARQILEQNPALASDLGIGRADLGRGYDDGGLVDLNTAPVGLLTGLLGLSPAQADQVAVARTAVGGFTSVDEIAVLTDLPLPELDRLRDRIVLSPR